jgi:hypothetical protein
LLNHKPEWRIAEQHASTIWKRLFTPMDLKRVFRRPGLGDCLLYLIILAGYRWDEQGQAKWDEGLPDL